MHMTLNHFILRIHLKERLKIILSAERNKRHLLIEVTASRCRITNKQILIYIILSHTSG